MDAASLWAVARETVRQHGPQAPVVASLEADRCLSDGKEAECDSWCAVARWTNFILERGEGPLH